MAKIDPLDRLVEDLRTYLRNLPVPIENDEPIFRESKTHEMYKNDIKEIVKKWVHAATLRYKKHKRNEQGQRVTGSALNSALTPFFFLWDWEKKVNWDIFESNVNHARKVTDEEIKKRIAHNDKVKAFYAQKKDPDSYRGKSRKKRKDGMLYFGVCTDRAFNMLVKNESSKIKIDGDFSYRVKWVHDVFSEKLWQHILDKKFLEKKKEERQMLSTKDIVAMTEELFSSFRQYLPVIRFTDKEFKEATGLKHLRNHEIAELVKKYTHLRLEGKSKMLLDSDTGKYTSIEVIGSIADVLIEETGKYSTRFHKPEHVYIFSPNVWGFVMFQNYLNKNYTKFPKEYYKLIGEGQELYRNIAQHEQSTFSPERVGKIMGYAEGTPTARIIERASKHLNKMKAAGLIDWKFIQNKEGKIRFCVWRTAPLQLETESRTGITESSADDFH